MIGRFFKKEKARVYLDKLVIIQRSEFKKIDEKGFLRSEDLEGEVRDRLIELFSFPHISARTEKNKSDLGLEVAIVQLQGAEFSGIALNPIAAIPIFWRPKIGVASRLYNIDSGKTIKTARYCAKMPWRQYLQGAFSMRGIFRYKPIFGINDLEPLLYLACHKVLSVLVKAT